MKNIDAGTVPEYLERLANFMNEDGAAALREAAGILKKIGGLLI